MQAVMSILVSVTGARAATAQLQAVRASAASAAGSTAAANSAAAGAAGARGGFSRMAQVAGQAGAAVAGMGAGAAAASGTLRGAQRGLERYGKNMQWMGRQIEYNFTLPIALAAGMATKWALDNERAMTRLQKVYGDTSMPAAQLTEETEALGRAFRFLSDNFGVALSEVIDAGATWAQVGAENIAVANGVRASLEMQILGEMELAEATEALIAVQAQYGASSSDLGQIIADLNAIENETTVRMRDLIDGMQRAGGVAREAGVDHKQLGGFIAAMVPAAGNAREAGNSLKTTITRIMAPTRQAEDAMRGLGIETDSTAWKNATATERFQELAGALEGVSTEQRTAALTHIAGRRQVSRLAVMLRDLTNENGRYAKAIEVTSDAEDTMLRKQRELDLYLRSGPQGFRILASQVKNYASEIGAQLIPSLLAVMGVIRNGARWFAELDPQIRNTVVALALLVAAVGPLVRYLGSTVLLLVRVLSLFLIIPKAILNTVAGVWWLVGALKSLVVPLYSITAFLGGAFASAVTVVLGPIWRAAVMGAAGVMLAFYNVVFGVLGLLAKGFTAVFMGTIAPLVLRWAAVVKQAMILTGASILQTLLPALGALVVGFTTWAKVVLLQSGIAAIAFINNAKRIVASAIAGIIPALAAVVTQAIFYAGTMVWAAKTATAIWVASAVRAIPGALASLATTIRTFVTGTLIPALAKAGTAMLAFAAGPWGMAVAAAIGVIYYFRDSIGNALRWIGENWNRMPEVIANALRNVVEVIRSYALAAYEWLSYLNPFARHSPSLVENVRDGVRIIAREYRSLASIGSVFNAALNALDRFRISTARARREMRAGELSKMRSDVVSVSPGSGGAFDTIVRNINALENALKRVERQYQTQDRVVATWQARLDSANRSLERKQDNLQRLRERASELSDALREAESSLNNFANMPIRGMRQFEDVLWANEMAQKELRLRLLDIEDAEQPIDDVRDKLARLQGDLEMLGGRREDLRLAGAGSDILGTYDRQMKDITKARDELMSGAGGTETVSEADELRQQLEDLRREAERTQLERDLKFDPLTRQIERMVDGYEEMRFADIVKGIRAQQKEVARLATEYHRANRQVEAQEKAVASATRSRDAVQASYDREYEKLQRLGEAYTGIQQLIRDMNSELDGFASAAGAAVAEAERAAAAAAKAAEAAARAAASGAGAGASAASRAAAGAARAAGGAAGAASAAARGLGAGGSGTGAGGAARGLGAGSSAAKGAAKGASSAAKSASAAAKKAAEDAAKKAAAAAAGAGGIDDLEDWGDFDIPGGDVGLSREEGDIDELLKEWADEDLFRDVFGDFDFFKPLRERWEQFRAWFASKWDSFVAWLRNFTWSGDGFFGRVRESAQRFLDVFREGGVLGDFWGSIQRSAERFWEALKNMWDWLSGPATRTWEFVRDNILQVIEIIKEQWNIFWENVGGSEGSFGRAMAAIGVGIEWLVEFVSQTLEVLAIVFASAWDGLLVFLQPVWDTVVRLFENGLIVLRNIFELALNLLAGDWSAAWENIKEIGAALWDSIVGVIEGGIEIIKGIFAGIWTFLKNLWQRIYDWLVGNSLIPDMVNAIVGWFEWLRDKGKEIWDAIVNFIMTPIRAVRDWLVEVWTNLTGWLSARWSYYSAMARIYWQALRVAISQAIERARDRVMEVVDRIRTWLSDRWSVISTTARTMWNILRERISTAIAGARDRVMEVVNRIRAWLSDRWSSIRDTTRDRWNQLRDRVRTAIENVRTRVMDIVTRLRAWLSDRWSNIRDTTRERWDQLRDRVRTAIENVRTRVMDIVSRVRAWLSDRWSNIRDTARDRWNQLRDRVRTAIESTRDRVYGVVRALRDWLTDRWNFIRDRTRTIWRAIRDIIGDTVGAARDSVQRAVDSIERIWDRIRRAMRTPIAAAVRVAVNPFIRGYNRVAKKVGLSEISTITIPQFHRGGVVGEAGDPRNLGRNPIQTDEQLAVLRKGERVLTEAERKYYEGDPEAMLPEVGGPLSWAKSVISSVANRVRDIIADIVRPLVRKGIDALGGIAGGSSPWGGVVRAVGRRAGSGVLDWIKGAEEQMPTAPKINFKAAGMLWPQLWKAIKGQFSFARLTSAYRPGARTAGSGRLSYHARGRAIDIAGATRMNHPQMLQMAQWIAKNYSPTELIYSRGPSRIRGRIWTPTGITRQNHFDHVHWAMDQGGFLNKGWNMPIYNGTGQPEIVSPERLLRSIMREEIQDYGSRGDRTINIYGNLEFPNISDGDDAEAFITNLESMVA